MNCVFPTRIHTYCNKSDWFEVQNECNITELPVFKKLCNYVIKHYVINLVGKKIWDS